MREPRQLRSGRKSATPTIVHPAACNAHCDCIGTVVGRYNQCALTHFNTITFEVGARGIGQHNARPIIVGKNQRTFDRSRGNDDSFGP